MVTGIKLLIGLSLFFSIGLFGEEFHHQRDLLPAAWEEARAARAAADVAARGAWEAGRGALERFQAEKFLRREERGMGAYPGAGFYAGEVERRWAGGFDGFRAGFRGGRR